MPAHVQAPPEPGRYELAFDLVHEHVRWFGAKPPRRRRCLRGGASGCSPSTAPATSRRRTRRRPSCSRRSSRPLPSTSRSCSARGRTSSASASGTRPARGPRRSCCAVSIPVADACRRSGGSCRARRGCRRSAFGRELDRLDALVIAPLDEPAERLERWLQAAAAETARRAGVRVVLTHRPPAGRKRAAGTRGVRDRARAGRGVRVGISAPHARPRRDRRLGDLRPRVAPRAGPRRELDYRAFLPSIAPDAAAGCRRRSSAPTARAARRRAASPRWPAPGSRRAALRRELELAGRRDPLPAHGRCSRPSTGRRPRPPSTTSTTSSSRGCSRAARCLAAFAWRRTLRRARLVIAISEAVKTSLVERYELAPERIRVVHHGVDRERFTPGDGPREPFLLYPAHNWPNKNHDRLIEAFGLLRAASGPSCGSSSPAAATRGAPCRTASSCAAGSRTTSCCGSTGRASALVFPSLYEGFGQPPLEAMACGCPVAAAPSGAIPEVCGDAALYFDPTSPESIAETVERVLDAPGGARRRAAWSARRGSRGRPAPAATRPSTATSPPAPDRTSSREDQAPRDARGQRLNSNWVVPSRPLEETSKVQMCRPSAVGGAGIALLQTWPGSGGRCRVGAAVRRRCRRPRPACRSS